MYILILKIAAVLLFGFIGGKGGGGRTIGYWFRR